MQRTIRETRTAQLVKVSNSTHNYCDRRRKFYEIAEKKFPTFDYFDRSANADSYLEIGSAAEIFSVLIQNFFDHLQVAYDDASRRAQSQTVDVTINFAQRAESFERYIVLSQQRQVAQDRPRNRSRRLGQHIHFHLSRLVFRFVRFFCHIDRHFHSALALVDQFDVNYQQ